MTSSNIRHMHATKVLECAPQGKRLQTDRDAVGLIGEALSQGAELVMIPVERFDDTFFQLKTRIAGEFIQKFVTYRRRLAIVGDIAHHLDGSAALRAFVSESNRGAQIWFVKDSEELDERLRRELGNRV